MYAAPTTPELWDAWHAAAGDAQVVGAIDAVHARIAEAVDDRRPRCDQSGRCCRFGDYGHDLFLTGLEIAVFLRRVEANPPAVSPPSAGRIALPQWRDDRVCPYMVDCGCSMHEVRPSGCRVFFCEPGTEDWQQSLYEEVLGELRRVHDEHGLPYRYMEWLDGLAAARRVGAS